MYSRFIFQDYDVELFLIQSWYDVRFQGMQRRVNFSHIDLNDVDIIQKVWKPDVYFPNAKSGDFQYVTVPNVLLRIGPGGTILYVLR